MPHHYQYAKLRVSSKLNKNALFSNSFEATIKFKVPFKERSSCGFKLFQQVKHFFGNISPEVCTSSVLEYFNPFLPEALFLLGENNLREST